MMDSHKARCINSNLIRLEELLEVKNSEFLFTLEGKVLEWINKSLEKESEDIITELEMLFNEEHNELHTKANQEQSNSSGSAI